MSHPAVKKYALALTGAALLAFTQAAPAATPTVDAPSARTLTFESVPVLSADGIVPHRAAYTIKMASAKNGSTVSDIAGRMFYAWTDSCHAWDLEQKTQLRFYYSEGDVSDNSTVLVSHEAKDGSSYNFHVRRTTDKEEPEIAHGYASLNIDGSGAGTGEAIYKSSEEKRFTLSGNTIFPVHHTLQLLAHARAGKKFFAMNVFDGADENAMNEISAFINSNLLEKASTASKNTNPLLQAKAWPIRMAFFAPGSETGSPDYEMDMVLLDNGIIKTMTIDYGDFAITADLADVKAVPQAKCPSTSANAPRS